MRIGVLGTGMVGRTIASKLVSLGHDVKMGSRTPDNEAAAEWVASAGAGASQGTFADAAAFGELVVNCTNGTASLDALAAAGAENLSGKVLVDVTNALELVDGRPTVATRDESVAERIQAAFPDARVVKSLNTMNCDVMVDPARVAGEHDVFVAGDDASAKEEVAALLESFGWARERIVDLGDISGARAAELYVVLWIRMYGVFGTSQFNIHVVR
jgi:predicted dinucleotide-binding enzyme